MSALFSATALFDYNATGESDLTLKEGDKASLSMRAREARGPHRRGVAAAGGRAEHGRPRVVAWRAPRRARGWAAAAGYARHARIGT